MNSFIGLLKKEFIISRFWFLIWLGIIVLSISASWIYGIRIENLSIVFGIFGAYIPLLLFFMPVMVLSLLRIEGRTQIWLHNPQSSSKLLFAKISASLIYQILSQIIVIFCGLLFNLWLQSQGVLELLPMNLFIQIYTVILFVSLNMAIWVLFLWTLYHSLGKYPSIKKMRWLFILIFIVGWTYIEDKIISFLSHSKFQLSIHVNLDDPFFDTINDQSTNSMEVLPIPVLPIIYYILITVVLFIAASKLLDKKVEV